MDPIQDELEKLIKRYIIQELESKEIVIDGVMIDDIISTATDAVEDAISTADDFVNDKLIESSDVDIIDSDSDENDIMKYQIEGSYGESGESGYYGVSGESGRIKTTRNVVDNDFWKDAWENN